MSSPKARPLPLFDLMEVRKIVERSEIQLDHLLSHVDKEDEVIAYWANHLRKQLRWIADELHEIMYDEEEESRG